METPIPTPYDIIDPLGFAYEPGWIAWVLLLVGGIALLAWAAGRRSRPRPGLEARDLARAELRRIGSALERESDLRRLLGSACTVARRVLSVVEGRELGSKTAAELKQIASELPRLAPTLLAVAETEALRFQPSEPQQEEARRLFLTIRETLEGYFQAAEREEATR